MSITSLDGIVAGAQYPREFFKSVTATLQAAGKMFSLLTTTGIPSISTVGAAKGNLPQTYPVTNISVANPGVVSCTSHPWANGDTVCFMNLNGTGAANGVDYTIANVVAGTSFTVGVNQTVQCTQGSCGGYTSNGGNAINGLQLGATNALSGAIPFTNPSSGNTYLSRFVGMSTAQAGTLILCDRLLHTGGYAQTLTTAQAGPSPIQIPSRDVNGSNAGTGCYAAFEVYATLGNSTATPAISYKNQAGNTNTGTCVAALANTAPAGTFIPFSLAAGDTGVRSINSLTLGATTTSGQFGVCIYRPLAKIELVSGVPNAVDAITGGFAQIYNDSQLFLVFYPNTTTATGIGGQIVWSQG